ncbi:hypothetical protein BUALT_Bualt01G0206400 [Buddleja alternifolia]|uniref:Uncharacterized protein n=1 Tax=Buddleja alternifolia TaxID=168488 RepID=A0AAV6YF91_9LAMI|nr:hypothetical protein BUALT_Bualt01G0206400 [Buddleja alternifolia]
MSIIYCVVVAFLCFSFHPCNARSFGVIHKELEEEFQNSISKKNERLNQVRVSEQPDMKSAMPNASTSAKIGSKFGEKSVKRESNEPGKHIDQAKGDQVKVSWRVPHKRKGEQEPGFNLDYLPPKTHPPVHN